MKDSSGWLSIKAESWEIQLDHQRIRVKERLQIQLSTAHLSKNQDSSFLVKDLQTSTSRMISSEILLMKKPTKKNNKLSQRSKSPKRKIKLFCTQIWEIFISYFILKNALKLARISFNWRKRNTMMDWFFIEVWKASWYKEGVRKVMEQVDNLFGEKPFKTNYVLRNCVLIDHTW